MTCVGILGQVGQFCASVTTAVRQNMIPIQSVVITLRSILDFILSSKFSSTPGQAGIAQESA